MELSKLSPAPWTPQVVSSDRIHYKVPEARIQVNTNPTWKVGDRDALAFSAQTDAEFIALSRDAFDVMMRRGWEVIRYGKQWALRYPQMSVGAESWVRFCDWIDANRRDNPFTVLKDSDLWYKENVEGGR